MAKVLIVEDDPAAMRLAAATLELEGHEVVGATNGLEGVSKARTEMPDVIVLDVMIPGMDGYEVCQALRSEEGSALSRVPILMVSAKAQSDDAEMGRKVGADAYVKKPVTPQALARAVAEALGERQGQAV